MASRTAPELTVVPPAPVPRGPLAVSAEDIPSFSVPALIVVAPVYVFAPESVQVPVPSLVSVRAPAITVEILPPVEPPNVIAVVPVAGVPVIAIVPPSPTMLAAVANVITPL